MTNHELADHLTQQWGPDLIIAALSRRLAAKEQDCEKHQATMAALIRRCAEQAHEIARLTLLLADKHAPIPEPSPAALAAIEAMQRGGIR